MTTIQLRDYVNQIEEMLDDEQYDAVLEHCRHVLNHFPRHIDTYRNMARAMLGKHQYDEAIDLFQRVLSADPNDFIAHIALSDLYKDKGQSGKASIHLERAFEIRPYNGAIREELLNAFEANGQEIPDGRAPLTESCLAHLYIRGEMYYEAQLLLSQLLAQDPSRVDLEVLLAEVLWRRGNRIEAAEVCLNVLEKLPNSIVANAILSEIWFGSDRMSDAKRYFRRLQSMVVEDKSTYNSETAVGAALTTLGAPEIPERIELEMLDKDKPLEDQSDSKPILYASDDIESDPGDMYEWLSGVTQPSAEARMEEVIEPDSWPAGQNLPETEWFQDEVAEEDLLAEAEDAAEWIREVVEDDTAVKPEQKVVDQAVDNLFDFEDDSADYLALQFNQQAEEGAAAPEWVISDDAITSQQPDPSMEGIEQDFPDDEEQGLPDWLSEAAKTDFEPLQIDPLTASQWLEEEEGEDVSAKPAAPPSEAESWLADIAQELDDVEFISGDDNDVDDWLQPTDAELSDTTSGLTDWLEDATKTPPPLSEGDDYAEDDELFPAEDFLNDSTSGLTDWLTDLREDAPADSFGSFEENEAADFEALGDSEPGTPLTESVSGLTDWLGNLVEDDTLGGDLPPENRAEDDTFVGGSSAGLTDWLTGLDPADSESDLSPDADELLDEPFDESGSGLTDWLMNPTDTDFSGQEIGEASAEEAADSSFDWLGDLTEGEAIDSGGWLSNLGDEDPPSSQQEDDGGVDDWFGQATETSSAQPVMPGEGDFIDTSPGLTDWLAGLSGEEADDNTAVSGEQSETISSDALFSDLDDSADMEQWLEFDMNEEAVNPSDPETPSEGETPKRPLSSPDLSSESSDADNEEMDWLADLTSDETDNLLAELGLSDAGDDEADLFFSSEDEDEPFSQETSELLDALAFSDSDDLSGSAEEEQDDWLSSLISEDDISHLANDEDDDGPVLAEQDALEPVSDDWLSALSLEEDEESPELIDSEPEASLTDILANVDSDFEDPFDDAELDVDTGSGLTDLFESVDAFDDLFGEGDEETAVSEPASDSGDAFDELSVTDWLSSTEERDSDDDLFAEMADSQDEEDALSLTNLLDATLDDEDEWEAGPEEDEEPAIDEPLAEDWLTNLGVVDEGDTAVPADDIPDWLLAAAPNAEDTSRASQLPTVFDSDEEEEEDAEFDFDDEPESVEGPAPTKLLERLQSDTPFGVPTPPPQDEEAFADELEIEEDQLEVEDMLSSPDDTAWLSQLDEGAVEKEEKFPDLAWLSEGDFPDAEAAVDAFEGDDEEEFEEEEEEDGLYDVPADLDDAMSWLDDLVADDDEPIDPLPTVAEVIDEPVLSEPDFFEEQETAETEDEAGQIEFGTTEAEEDVATETEMVADDASTDSELEDALAEIDDAMAWLHNLADDADTLEAATDSSLAEADNDDLFADEWVDEDNDLFADELDDEDDDLFADEPDDEDDDLFVDELDDEADDLDALDELFDEQLGADDEPEPALATVAEQDLAEPPYDDEFGDVPEDIDDAMAWLEQLAARQGAPLDELPSLSDASDEEEAEPELLEGMEAVLDDFETEESIKEISSVLDLEPDPDKETLSTPTAVSLNDDLADALDWLETIAGSSEQPANTPAAAAVQETSEEELAEALDWLEQIALTDGDAPVEASLEDESEAITPPDFTLDELISEDDDQDDPDETAVMGGTLSTDDLGDDLAGFFDIPDDPDAALAWLEESDSEMMIEETDPSEAPTAEQEPADEEEDEDELPTSSLLDSGFFDIPDDPEAALAWLEESDEQPDEDEPAVDADSEPEPGEETDLPATETAASLDDDFLASVPEDPDEAMAWLEQLAARQGAPLEELPTVDTMPSEIETPGWVTRQQVEADIEPEEETAVDAIEPEDNLDDILGIAEESHDDEDVVDSMPSWLGLSLEVEDDDSIPTEAEWLDTVPKIKGTDWLTAEGEAAATLSEDIEPLPDTGPLFETGPLGGTGPLPDPDFIPESEPEIEPEPIFSSPSSLTEEPDSAVYRLDEDELNDARDALAKQQYDQAATAYQSLVVKGSGLLMLIGELEGVTKDQPDQPAFRRLLGDAYMRNGQLQKALTSYREALDQL